MTTAGSRAFKWYGGWQRQRLSCSRCGWTGIVETKDLGDLFSDSATIECPRCYRSLGVVLFPNLRETEEAAAQANEEAIQALPEMKNRLEPCLFRNS